MAYIIEYTAPIRTGRGTHVVLDIDCEISARVEFDDGTPVLDIREVYIKGNRLDDAGRQTREVDFCGLLGERDTALRELGWKIVATAKADRDLLREFCDKQGVPMPSPAFTTINHSQTGVSRGRAA